MRRLLRFCVITLLLFSTRLIAKAAEIKGHLYDKDTKEQIIGANVVIKSINKVAVTGLDGSFFMKNLPAGTYILSISYVGYKPIEQSVTLNDNNQVINLNILQEPSTNTLNEVQIKGHADGGSEAFANSREKNSDNILNILSAKAIEISPDITVSEVMQRVSGVSMESNNSGDQYAIIRGMDKRYNTTLINGVKIPSPDDKDRFVPLDIFPAELLQRLEVVKTLTPSMEGDATGGSINLVMKDAPEKPMLEANLAVGYSSVFQNQDFQKFSTADVSKKSPAESLGLGAYAPVSAFPSSNLVTSNMQMPLNTNMSLSLGNRFYNNKLGVIVSGSYQNIFSGYHSENILENPTTSPPSEDVSINNIPAFKNIQQRVYSTLSKRLGIMTKIDYRINDNNTISLFATHIQLDQYRVRNIIDSVPGGTSFNNTWTNIIGTKYHTETRSTLQNIDNITLQGNHKLNDKFSFDWSLVGSEAKRQLPNDAEFNTAIKDSMITDPTTGVQKYLTAYPYKPYVTGKTDEWEHNTDQDLAVYLNLHYKINSLPFLRLIDAGGLYRDKHRDNYDIQYSLNQTIAPGQQYQVFTTIPEAQLEFTPTNAALGNEYGNAGTYTFHEDILAYYVQAHINIGSKLKILGGVRAENTIQSYVCGLPITRPGKTGDYNYIDVLPSIQGKYDLTPKSGIRLSYYKSINRPAYSDLIPFPNPLGNEDYPTIGNPYVQHSVIHNADIRYELFPKGLDQFMIGGFYKYIINPIEKALYSDGINEAALMPGNFGDANNYGIEMVARKFFGNFGISGNYTYTHSDINSSKEVYYKDNGNAVYGKVNQHRPLQGQAAHIGNLSLLYKNKEQKIEAQLAFVYTGERISTVSYYKDLDVWEKPILNLDFSVQKQIGKHFTAYLKLKNLLNTGDEYFIKQPNTAYSAPSKLPYQESANYYTLEHDYYYSSMLIGVKYKLN